MRGLFGLLAAIAFAVSVILVWRGATGSPLTAECAVSAAICGGGAAVHRQPDPTGPTDAAPPPTDDDPNRQHADPGVWPDLVFIVGLFAFALVMRGSRPRRVPDDIPERREP